MLCPQLVAVIVMAVIYKQLLHVWSLFTAVHLVAEKLRSGALSACLV